MRYAFAASSLLGLASAAPQMINIEAALAVPTPTILGPQISQTKPAPITYDPTAAASAVVAVVQSQGAIEKRDVYDPIVDAMVKGGTSNEAVSKRDVYDPIVDATVKETTGGGMKTKRNACAAQPLGAGPVPSPDTAASFLQASSFSQTATGASTPSGYKQSFVNLSGSSQQIGYLTYKTYNTYDVQGCADACNSERYCRGFNIFFERDPSVEPGPNCADPPSTTNIKCSLYGYPVAGNAATNTGQWREQFQVVIAGSNGYSKLDKSLPTVDDFKAPTSLSASINAPLDNGYDTYNGMRLFNDNPYDPALCAAACEAQTVYDKAHPDSNGNYKPCNFFTSYILTKNEVPLGTYCALYTRTWDSSYATNTGYYDGNDEYKVVSAASYEITTPDNGGRSSTPGPNVLTDPGFEEYVTNGWEGSMPKWPNTGGGRVYSFNYPGASHGGSSYGIMYYEGTKSNPTPVMSQSLTGLDTTKPYTLTFFHDLYSIYGVSGCTLSVALGDKTIYTKVFTASDTAAAFIWSQATSTPVIPSSSTETLSFRYQCTPSGAQSNAGSFIFFDDASFNTS